MTLDDVRSLKLRFLNHRLPYLLEDPPTTDGALLPSLLDVSPSRGEPLVAAGVGLKKSGYALAIRLSDADFLHAPFMKSIQREAAGEVDVRVVGRISALEIPWRQRRVRPLKPGVSIGHFHITAGTLGAFVRHRSNPSLTKQIMILSNNHVLANANLGRIDDAILQPGPEDQGRHSQDLIAHLTDYSKLVFRGTNRVDAAIATLAEGIGSDLAQARGYQLIRGAAIPERVLETDLPVIKTGRTTGTTWGYVTATEMSGVSVRYGNRTALFENQIEIESLSYLPFSQGGDSGSLVTTPEGEAIGLLFAGAELGGENGYGLTYANPIQAVLDALAIEFVTG